MQTRDGALRVLIAGGGTGGHLFPGIAVARELVGRVDAEVCFVGSHHGIERTAVPRAGFPVELLPIRGVRGEGWRGVLRAAWRVPRSFALAWSLLGRMRPRLVIGVGGYAAFPALAAAVVRRRPIVLLEQNARPGLVTRIFAPFSRAVCASFPETLSELGAGAVLTGNPIRWPASDSGDSSAQRSSAEQFQVLVFGGSAGAHRLNVVVPDALGQLEGRVRVLHQTGVQDREAVARRYEELGISAEVVEFIDDMQVAYRDCDVAICRSGATTLAELTVLGVAAILVPYPFAAGDHQRTNAQALVDAGAAWMVLDRDLEVSLGACLQDALADPAAPEARRQAARSLGRPRALEDVVGVCLEAAEGAPGSASPGEGG